MKIVNSGIQNSNIFLKKLFNKTISSKFARRLYKPALTIVGLQIIALPLIIHYNRPTIKYALGIHSRNDLFSIFDRKVSNLKDYKSYLGDILKATFGNESLDRVDLNINIRNISRIKPLQCSKNGMRSKCREKIWAKAFLNSNGNSFDVRLRQKGTRSLHHTNLDFKKMSLRVNVKGENRFYGMSEFAIQIPPIRGYDTELLAAKALERENIITPRHRYISFYINGEYVGIRHLEEIVSKELIESKKRRYGPVFELNKDYGDDYFTSRFQLRDPKDWSAADGKLAKQAITILELSKQNKAILFKYFDIPKWSKYMAFMDIFQTFHGTEASSVKYFLDPTRGLIEPILWDGHIDKWNKNTRLSDIAYNFSSQKECSLNLIGSIHAVDVCNQINWYQLFFGTRNKINQDFYINYFRSLEEISSKEYEEVILKLMWNDLSVERGNLYKGLWRSDEFHRMGPTPYIGSWHRISSRIKQIREEVSFARKIEPLISYETSNSRLIHVLNQHSRLPQILNIRCQDNESNPIVLIKGKQTKFDLSQLGGRCNASNSYYTLDNFENIINITSNYSIEYSLQKKLNNLSKNKIKTSDKYIFNGGDKVIFHKDTDINLDKIIFEPGSSICIDRGATLTLSAPTIQFKSDPILGHVTIQNCDDKGGSLIIENSDVLIDKLYVSRLTAPSLDLKALYGGINIINSNVSFQHININESRSEDGINFINSLVKGSILNASNIISDAVDSDNSVLNLEHVKCINISNDCIDFSFSLANIGEVYAYYVKDKVISLGENSLVNVRNFNANKSEMGLVSKDKSTLTVNEASFSDVNLPIVSFVKKPEFGDPIVNLLKVNKGTLRQSLIAHESSVFLGDEQLDSNYSSIEILNKLYGNQFGVKTIR
tara:strand:+ start:1156 stop:3813 length:2658 start_codon:yes stop_codon:yes gene_type:complete